MGDPASASGSSTQNKERKPLHLISKRHMRRIVSNNIKKEMENVLRSRSEVPNNGDSNDPLEIMDLQDKDASTDNKEALKMLIEITNSGQFNNPEVGKSNLVEDAYQNSNRGNTTFNTQGVNNDVSNQEILRKLISIEVKLNVMNAQQLEFQSEMRKKLNIRKPYIAKGNDDFFTRKFPLNTTEEINLLEEDLFTKEDFKNELMVFLSNVGGTDGKNMISRMLKRVFTNELGEKCSWTGQKSNFKLKDLKLMAVIKECVQHQFETNDKDFEIMIMNWFRGSKLRKDREYNKQFNSISMNM